MLAKKLLATAGQASATPATATHSYTGSTTGSNLETSITISGASTTSNDVVIGVAVSAAGADITSVTYNGSSATELHKTANYGSTRAGFYHITGVSSGDIVANFGAGTRASIFVFEVDNLQSTTLYDVGDNGSGTNVSTINLSGVACPADGFRIAVGSDNQGRGHSWTNATELVEHSSSGQATQSVTYDAGSFSGTVTLTLTNIANIVLCSISMQ